MRDGEEQSEHAASIHIGILQVLVIPVAVTSLYSFDLIRVETVWCWLFFHVFLFAIIPLAGKYSNFVQRHAVFLNYINYPVRPDYNSPTKYGIDGVRNMYLTTEENVTLGVWHVLPQESLEQAEDLREEALFEDVLKNGPDVIIYTHGNSGSRLGGHRIELYKLLRKKYQVITFDYRGYADSSNLEPDELGLVRDTMFVYRWVRKRTNKNVIIWGHSLGTAISTRSLVTMFAENESDESGYSGLILESPFTNIRDQVYEYPITKIFSNLPWFKYTIVDALTDNNFRFDTDTTIKNLTCPIMILHAKDDNIVPFKLGKRLYETTKKHRSSSQYGSIRFYEFDADKKYGHKYICRAPNLSDIVDDFVRHCIGKSN